MCQVIIHIVLAHRIPRSAAMTKKEIRQVIKSEKSQLSDDMIQKASSIVTKKLLNSIEYQNSKVIYLYLSFNQEIRTDEIIYNALKNKKKVAVPRIDTLTSEEVKDSNIKRKKKMNFYYIQSMEELQTGFYGILEPVTNNVAYDKEVLVIMPGLAFDNKFYRIGYGGGYYDDFLNSYKKNNYTKIALAYDFQLMDEFEHNDYDVRVDQIITPTTHRKKF
jgi:5-formyltetrahydrofolate cyclo-ligase